MRGTNGAVLEASGPQAPAAPQGRQARGGEGRRAEGWFGSWLLHADNFY